MKGKLPHLSAVDVAEGAGRRLERDYTLGVLEDAVLAHDVRADQLDVLGQVGLRRTDTGCAHLHREG